MGFEYRFTRQARDTNITMGSMATKEQLKSATEHTEDRLGATVEAAVNLSDQLEDEKLSPWTPALFRLYTVLAAAYLCGCLVRFLLKNVLRRDY